jgi:hypothetical protein
VQRLLAHDDNRSRSEARRNSREDCPIRMMWLDLLDPAPVGGYYRARRRLDLQQKETSVMSGFGKVLIVDNDEFALIELERVLEGAGFDTTTTWDVSEAVHLANTTGYDYILVGECFNGRNAEELWHSKSLGGRVQRCVILSARNMVLGTDLPTPGPITVCKRRANDVLRALSGERDRSLGRAA